MKTAGGPRWLILSCRRAILLMLLFAVSLMSGAIHADAVQLRNGQTVYGQITGQTRTTVTVRTPNGMVVLQKGDILRISYGPTAEEQAAERRRLQELERQRQAAIEAQRAAEEAARRAEQEEQSASEAQESAAPPDTAEVHLRAGLLYGRSRSVLENESLFFARATANQAGFVPFGSAEGGPRSPVLFRGGMFSMLGRYNAWVAQVDSRWDRGSPDYGFIEAVNLEGSEQRRRLRLQNDGHSERTTHSASAGYRFLDSDPVSADFFVGHRWLRADSRFDYLGAQEIGSGSFQYNLIETRELRVRAWGPQSGLVFRWSVRETTELSAGLRYYYQTGTMDAKYFQAGVLTVVGRPVRTSEFRTTSDYLFRGLEFTFACRQELGSGMGVFAEVGLERASSSLTNTRARSLIEARSDTGLDLAPAILYIVGGSGLASSGLEGNVYGAWNKARGRDAYCSWAWIGASDRTARSTGEDDRGPAEAERRPVSRRRGGPSRQPLQGRARTDWLGFHFFCD